MKLPNIITSFTTLFILNGCDMSSRNFYIKLNEPIVYSADELSGFNKYDVVYKHARLGWIITESTDLNQLREDKSWIIYKIHPVDGYDFDVTDCFTNRSTTFGAILDYIPSKTKTRVPSNNDTLSCTMSDE